MQQTSIDRWLRKKFLFITTIYCNTLPQGLPETLDVDEAGAESGGRFRYKLTTRDEEVVAEAVECYRMQNITYTTRVYDREVWFNKYLTNRNKSVTFQVVWVMILMGIVGVVVSGAPIKLYNYVMADEVVEEELDSSDPADDVKISTVGATVIEIDRQR